jgi:hypothetical protein
MLYQWPMARALFVVFVVGCLTNDPHAGDTVAATVRGHIQLADVSLIPGAPAPAQSQLGGNLNIYFFATSAEDYCLLVPATIAFEHLDVLQSPAVDALITNGNQYEFTLYEGPNTTYPVTVFPYAVLQNTATPAHSCERDTVSGAPRYNAVGYYQLDTPEKLGAAGSACCLAKPKPLVIPGPGAVLDGVDFALFPVPVPPALCPLRGTAPDICALRHAPPPKDAQDSMCYQALGDEASLIFRTADGEPCP